jgi:hypothetical protein
MAQGQTAPDQVTASCLVELTQVERDDHPDPARSAEDNRSINLRTYGQAMEDGFSELDRISSWISAASTPSL